jgi:hypothetical protein
VESSKEHNHTQVEHVRLCINCKKAAAGFRSRWCLQCELSGDAAKQQGKKAKCLFRGCDEYRYKDQIMCELHSLYVDEEDIQVELIYEWCMKCVMCSRYRLAVGTKAMAQATKLLYKQRCAKCGGRLELEDEGRVVGRYRVDTQKYH